MLKTFYIQLLALIAILCYPINLSADDYSLAPSTGRKVYVPIHAKSAKGLLSIPIMVELRLKTSHTSFLTTELLF